MTKAERRRRARERLEGRVVTEPRERLRALREAAGLGEEALGDKFNVKGPSVHDWEHGRRDPSPTNRKLIEAWSIEAIRDLGIDVRPIFAGDWPHAQAITPPEAS